MENFASGIGWEDGDAKLLDLRFANDLLLFARSKLEALSTLEILMAELAYVGLCLSAGTTLVSTNEVEPRTRQRCWTNQ